MKLPVELLVSEDLIGRIRQRDMDPPAVMATSAVMAIEVLHDDGLHYLHVLRSDEATAWRAIGMARCIEQQAMEDIGARDDDEGGD